MIIRPRLEAAYDRVASAYAERHANMPARIAELGARFLEQLKPGIRLLDAGCGPGRDMAWLEAQGFRVTGIDISTGMLAQARSHVHGELLQMDLCQLTFPPASFEGIWCSSAFLHIPKAQAPDALRELRRVLTPDGMFFLSTLGGDGEGWEENEFAGVERFFVRHSLEEMKLLLAQAGFAIVECYWDEVDERHVWLNVIVRTIE